ncbi:uncharacterized protein LOC129905263 [Episyrphus balteatus]|uniref:uncharacterized protein LOC129905263 n=1 Tax=Episyrphus balteatus TaxID=286459 RepID=UPI0024864D9D|nr:uncharacterized protein LOC129905263 [Episyrphus balteatus]
METNQSNNLLQNDLIHPPHIKIEQTYDEYSQQYENVYQVGDFIIKNEINSQEHVNNYYQHENNYDPLSTTCQDTNYTDNNLILNNLSLLYQILFDGTYFTFKSRNDKTVVASCMVCEPPKDVKGTIDSTWNFRMHLKRYHGDAIIEDLNSHLRWKKSLLTADKSQEIEIISLLSPIRDDDNDETSQIVETPLSSSSPQEDIEMTEIIKNSTIDDLSLRKILFDGRFFELKSKTAKTMVATCKVCKPHTLVQSSSSFNFRSHLILKHDKSVMEELDRLILLEKWRIEKNSPKVTNELLETANISQMLETLNISQRILFDGHYFELKFKDDESKIIATCMVCYPHKDIKGTSSSNFKSHIKRIHGDRVFDELNEYISFNSMQLKKLKDDTEEPSTSKRTESIIDERMSFSKKKHKKTIIDEMSFSKEMQKESDYDNEFRISEGFIKTEVELEDEVVSSHNGYYDESMDEEMDIESPITSNSNLTAQDLCLANQKLLNGKYFQIKSRNGRLLRATCKLCDPPKHIKGVIDSSSNFVEHLKKFHGKSPLSMRKEIEKNISLKTKTTLVDESRENQQRNSLPLPSSSSSTKMLNETKSTLPKYSLSRKDEEEIQQRNSFLSSSSTKMLNETKMSNETKSPLPKYSLSRNDKEEIQQRNSLSSSSSSTKMSKELKMLNETKMSNETKSPLPKYSLSRKDKEEIQQRNLLPSSSPSTKMLNETKMSKELKMLNDTKMLNETKSPLPKYSNDRMMKFLSLDNQILFDGKYFELLSNLHQHKIVICQLCQPCKELRGNSSTHFRRHVKMRHGKAALTELNEYILLQKGRLRKNKHEIQMDLLSSTTSTSSTTTRRESTPTRTTTTSSESTILPKIPKLDEESVEDKQTQFNTNVLNYFLRTLTPLNEVESSEFLALFDCSTNARITRITQEELIKQIEMNFKTFRSKITAILENVDFVCITIDLWSSKFNHYFTITCHWLDAINFKRKSVALACKRFDDFSIKSSADIILKETLNNYNLPMDKIVSSISNNCYNFSQIFKDLNINTKVKGDTINENHTVPFQEEIKEFLPHTCNTSTLSSIVTIDIPNVINSDSSLKSIHELTLKKVFSFLSLASTHAEVSTILADLKNPDVSKWSSIYDSISSVLNLEEKSSFVELFEMVKLEPFSDEEVKYLREYVKCFKPLAMAFKRLECEQSTYQGFILPVLLEMRKECEKILESNEISVCRPILETIVGKSVTRFDKYFKPTPQLERLTIASISHPYFKEEWLSAIDQLEKNEGRTLFVNAVKFENSKSNKKEANEVNQETEKCREEIDDFYFGDDDPKHNKSQLSVEIEALRYLSDERKDLKMLDDYPAVKQVFLKYNTALSSSEPFEKLFPYETRQYIARYENLEEELFEERVLLSVNKDELFS